MRFKLIPTDEGFYPLFSEAAENLVESARLLRSLLEDFDAGDEMLRLIVERERHGDELTRTILHRVNGTFVPPFDREDIHLLTEKLDDAVDDIQAAADLLILHNVEQPLPEMREMADILVAAGEATVSLIGKLETLRDTEPDLERIDQLESVADRVYRRCVARLFSGEFKAFAVLRSKDIVEALEAAVNGIEDIGDVVETIVLKHA